MKNQIRAKQLLGPSGEIIFGNRLIKQGEFTVHTLVYHEGIHWDEVVADLIMREAGNKFFPAIADAKIRFAPRNEVMTDPFSALQKGEIWIGCGNSPFNEHETPTRGAVEENCAATLTAFLLNEERKEFRKLLNDAYVSDRDPQTDAGHVHNVMKAMREGGANDETVFSWASEAAKAIYINQLNFFQGAVENFDDFGKIELVNTDRGQQIRVAVINTETRAFSNYALANTPRGKDATIVITMGERGNLAVLTNKRHDVAEWLVLEMYRVLALKHCSVTKQPIPDAFRKQGNKLPEDIGVMHLWSEGGGILGNGDSIGFSLDEAFSIVKGVVNRMRAEVHARGTWPKREKPLTAINQSIHQTPDEGRVKSTNLPDPTSVAEEISAALNKRTDEN